MPIVPTEAITIGRGSTVFHNKNQRTSNTCFCAILYTQPHLCGSTTNIYQITASDNYSYCLSILLSLDDTHHSSLSINNLHQQMRETVMTNFVDIVPNTTTNFLNMRTASAPIQNMEAREKYWMINDMMVHSASNSVRPIPIMNQMYIPSRAMNN